MPALSNRSWKRLLVHTLQAPRALLSRNRVVLAWGLLLQRHPLIAAHIHSSSYADTSFVTDKPATVSETLEHAAHRLLYLSSQDPDAITPDSFFNGPRVLGPDQLARLQVVTREVTASGSATDDTAHFEVTLMAVHCIGDSASMQSLANELYVLLGSSEEGEMIREIESTLCRPAALPPPAEDRMPRRASALATLVGREEYERSENHLIGGQAFPRARVSRSKRIKTIRDCYSRQETQAMLAQCKRQGVSITHAMFAAANLAWALHAGDQTLPTLFYSAQDVRRRMSPIPGTSNQFLAVGYLSVVLACTRPPPLTVDEWFWHRARQAKTQMMRATQSLFVIPRSLRMWATRKQQALAWAVADDAADQAPTLPNTVPGNGTAAHSPASKESVISRKALMGISALGNVDAFYSPAAFPHIQLVDMTCGTKSRAGGALMFSYTFGGQFHLSANYDEHYYDEDVMERFWDDLKRILRACTLDP